jgi:hypothetical protein
LNSKNCSGCRKKEKNKERKKRKSGSKKERNKERRKKVTKKRKEKRKKASHDYNRRKLSFCSFSSKVRLSASNDAFYNGKWCCE